MYAISFIFCLLINLSSVYPFGQYFYTGLYDFFPINYEQNQFESGELTCRDEITGEPLDWFTLYKLPKRSAIEEYSDVNNPFVYEGTAYSYLTNKAQTSWQLSSLSMNDTSSFAGKTLDVLYKTKFSDTKYNNTNLNSTDDEIGYILYNDQADKVTLKQGHTKGIIIFNENSAIWIVHSIPHFPPKPSESNYQIHHSQCIFGQSFLCMSIKPQELEKIGKQLKYTYPQVYDYHIPQFAEKNPDLQNLLSVLDGDHVKQAPWHNLEFINTVGGEQMLSFAKFTDFEDDLYAALISPYFKSNLFTETWNNGRGTLESNCSELIDYQVHNIEQINFKTLGIRFSVHHDHSKWAVTTEKYFDNKIRFFKFIDEFKHIACIGDINRQEEQFKRAGGTVCFLDNINVWQQYSSIVDEVEPCKKKMFKQNIFKRATQGKRFKFKGSTDKIVMLG